uniref:Symplectin/biotinidase-like protein 2 n=1 Tax=Pterygioteuthis hoylei TaxID=559549 RepID=A0A2Z5EQ41_PTEHO|nr:symplectin/biotinidase-like protein 2 [Pterygioteuthis hoylei]
MGTQGSYKFAITRRIPSLILFICWVLLYVFATTEADRSFSVYVFQSEFTFGGYPPSKREDAVKHMEGHIAKYEKEALKAKNKGSQLVVFPEYCLYADIQGFTRQSIELFLERIPDPKVNFNWAPCDLDSSDDIIIQRRFSCMAKKNNLYIVANVGEREDCNTDSDSRCPSDGRYQFNTNVVYSPNGTLVSRYRKKHLFYEPYFNEPEVAERGVFETPFGKFASIICFDIYYQDTLQDLINETGVRNIIFPNMWFNTPPLFNSVPFHASIAWATSINLISANLIMKNEPKNGIAARTGGSGLYHGADDDGGDGRYYTLYREGEYSGMMDNLKSDLPSRFAMVPPRKTPGHGQQKVTNLYVNGIVYNSVKLIDTNGSIGVCNGDFCCGLDYEFEYPPTGSITYWLATSEFHEFQACLVCALVYGKSWCESLPFDENVQFSTFKHLRMYANNFKTPFVFPQVVTVNRTYYVLDPSGYYKDGEINFRPHHPVHSMALIDRIYDAQTSGNSRPIIISIVLVVGMLVLSLLCVKPSYR